VTQPHPVAAADKPLELPVRDFIAVQKGKLESKVAGSQGLYPIDYT